MTQVSNVLGTENPVALIVDKAHQVGAKVLIDGAQAVMHHAVDVQALGCDFYVFSGHKLYGPTGHRRVLRERGHSPGHAALGRGRVNDRHRQPDGGHNLGTRAPWRFEAGTPNTAGSSGWARPLATSLKLGWRDSGV